MFGLKTPAPLMVRDSRKIELAGARQPGIMGFEQNTQPPHGPKRSLRDFEVHTAHGVPKALGASHFEPSRGTAKVVRDIVVPAKCMPWRKSAEQIEFMKGTTTEQRRIYQKITEAIYSSAGAHGPDIAAGLHDADRHGSGRISREAFERVLKGLCPLQSSEVEDLCRKLEPPGERSARSVDYKLFLRVFWEDQQGNPADSTEKNRAAGHGAAVAKAVRAARQRENQVEETEVGTTPTLSRQQWLREKLRDAGGRRGQYRTVAKLLKLFREAGWKGQDQLIACLRAGDRRGTGALRRREFVQALGHLGLRLDEAEYDELFCMFDKDGSGDVTLDELAELLSDEHLSPAHPAGSGEAVVGAPPLARERSSAMPAPNIPVKAVTPSVTADGRPNSAHAGQRHHRRGSGPVGGAQGLDDASNQRMQPLLAAGSPSSRRPVSAGHVRGNAALPNARYVLDKQRRAILKDKAAPVWRAFNKISKRLHELVPVVDKVRLMNAIDFNHNGFIDKNELRKGLRYLGLELNDDDARELFVCLDADGSGYIDSEEICILLEV